MVWFSLDWYALLRFCGALAVLLLSYYMLFDRKAPYKHCRIYLLTSVVVALLVSVVRIPVYPVGVEQNIEKWSFVEEKVDSELVMAEARSEVSDTAVIATVVPSVAEKNIRMEHPQVQELAIRNWDQSEILPIIYICIVFLLALRWCFAVVKIMRLKKWGSCSSEDHFTIVRNNRVTSPFSFLKTIYINRKLDGETLEIVLSHEKSHIMHGHYRDTFLMELFSIIFWFNPFVWLIRRELRALHEFEVDHSLLSGGIELSGYQNVIFSELMGYSPNVANGFHNSLIKKRFIMMKRGCVIRYTLLRKILLLPVVGILVVLFAFTVKENDGATTDITFSSENMVSPFLVPDMLDTPLTGQVATAGLILPEVIQKPDGNIPEVTKLQGVPEPEKQVVARKIEEQNIEQPRNNYQEERIYDDESEIELSERQLVESSHPFQGWTSIRYIEPLKNETRVVVITPLYDTRAWIKFNKGYCLVDNETGDIYKIRSVTRDMPLNKKLWFSGNKGQMMEFTMIFPPLKSKVKRVDLCDMFPGESGPAPAGGQSWEWRRIPVAAYLPPKDRTYYYQPDGSRKFERKLRHQTLTDSQIVELPGKIVYKTRIYRIETDKNETRVTLAVPIVRDENWTLFDKGFCIVDCRNGDEYKIRSLTRGMELNTALWIYGKSGRMVEFTMVFPPLKPKTKVINLYTKYPEESVAPPSAGEPWDWRNIRIENYMFPKGEIIY